MKATIVAWMERSEIRAVIDLPAALIEEHDAGRKGDIERAGELCLGHRLPVGRDHGPRRTHIDPRDLELLQKLKDLRVPERSRV